MNTKVKPSIKQTKTTKSKTATKSKSTDKVAALSSYTRAQIASHMFVIVSAIVVNPEFVDQAKTKLKTPMKQFETSCRIPENTMSFPLISHLLIDALESKS